MGTIMLQVPKDIHLAYKIDSLKMMEQLLDLLTPLKKQSIKNHKWLVDEVSEKNCSETLSQQAYAAAMQDYLSRPAKPLKDFQESYPPREELYDRGKFC